MVKEESWYRHFVVENMKLRLFFQNSNYKLTYQTLFKEDLTYFCSCLLCSENFKRVFLKIILLEIACTITQKLMNGSTWQLIDSKNTNEYFISVKSTLNMFCVNEDILSNCKPIFWLNNKIKSLCGCCKIIYVPTARKLVFRYS